jgi:hypothetical protein
MKIAFVAAALVLIFKLSLLALIGPVHSADTPSYSNFADAMIASSRWLHDAGLTSDVFPITTFRIIGYPAVIAAAKLLAGSAWPYAIVGVQFAVSTGVFIAVFYLGVSLGLSQNWALAGALAYATSLQLSLDQCLMSDSLNASMIILAVVIFLRGMDGAKVRAWQIVTGGLLLAAAFLTREILPYLMIALLPLFAIRCAYVTAASRFARFAPCLLVCVPLIAAYQGYELWNWHRTGERFVTTTAQLNALLSVVYAAKTEPSLFAGDSPLDHHAAPLLKQHKFEEAVAINDALFRGGYVATQISHMALDKYAAAWRQHPLAMLNLIRIGTSENILKLAVRPIKTVCEIFEWSDRPLCFDYRDLYRKLFHHPADVRFGEAAAFIAITVQNALSIAVSALFFAGIPILLVMAWRSGTIGSDRPLAVAAGFWMLVAGWHLISAEVIYNDRYMMPVIPFIIIGGLIAANSTKIWLRKWSFAAR